MTISFINIQTASRQQLEEFVINEIRKRIDNSFLGEANSSNALYGMRSVIANVLKEMEAAGVIERPLDKEDVDGITQIMLLEWSVSNFDGAHFEDSKGYTIPVHAHNIRTICGGLSTAALEAMTAPYANFNDCQNTARFFFLEKLRRDGTIDDWDFRWTNPQSREGTLSIEPKQMIKSISVKLGIDP